MLKLLPSFCVFLLISSFLTTIYCDDDGNDDESDEQQLAKPKSPKKVEEDIEEFIHPTGTTGAVRRIISDLLHRKTTPSGHVHPFTMPDFLPHPHSSQGPEPGPQPTPQPQPWHRPTPSPGPELRYPGGNLQLQLTNKFLVTVLYYLRLFVDQWTKQFSLANVERDQQATLNLRMIRDAAASTLDGQYKTGMIEFTLTIPKIQASGNFKAKSGVSGAFTSDVTFLVGTVQVTVRPSSSKQPNFHVLQCSSTAKFNTIFRDSSLQGSALDELRSFTEKNIADGFSKFLCDGAKYLILVINTAYFDMQSPIYSRVRTYDGAPTPEIDMGMVCGPENVFTPPAPLESIVQDITGEQDGLSLDLTMNSDHAYVSDRDMIIGMRGDFRQNDVSSGLRMATARPIYYTDRAMCFIVNETLVNSFFQQAFRKDFFERRFDAKMDTDVPADVMKQVSAFCPGTACQIYVKVNVTEPPEMDFRLAVPRTRAKMRMNLYAQSGDRVEHIAETQMDLEINSIVYYESVAIKSYPTQGAAPKTQLHHVFLPNLLDNNLQSSLKVLMTNIYNNRIWPFIDTKYRKMLTKRGIRIPNYCGLVATDPYVFYGDGHVYYCNNFIFYYDQFMARYNRWKLVETSG